MQKKRLQNYLVTFFLLGFCLFGISLQTGYAQTKTWTGNTDSNWHNPANWNPVGIPTASNDIQIQPNSGNPYPVISENDVTVANMQISNWSGGELTVSNERTLTITNGLTFNSGGSLFIESEGAVNLTGGSFNMAYNNTLIDITNGSFSSDVDIEIRGDGFSAGSGTVTINANFTLPNSKVFNVESADVTINNITEINGTFNGDDGYTIFENNVEIESGGIVNLDTGTIIFNGDANVRSNGTLNMGSGTVNLNSGLTAESDGNINVEDGNLNVQGDANFQNNGNLSVDNGSVDVTGNATLQNGGSFNFTSGSLTVGGNSSFTNGGTVNAGDSQMEFQGDLEIPYSGTFNADSSTVTFSGDETQTINTGGDDVTFHSVVVKSGSSVQTDGSSENTITIENDLTVEEGGKVDVQDDDTIDIQGNLDNQGDVKSEKPFVYNISTPSLNEVLITFDKHMDPATSENVSNYSINQGISISDATQNPSDSTKVSLDVSTLSEGVEYELTVNNVKAANGGEISDNHIKRFTAVVDITYYSRTSGNWDDPNSWSIDSHTGAAASSTPTDQSDEKAVIAGNHIITLGSTQNVSIMDTLVVGTTGTLRIASGDTLILGDFIIGGSGTFELNTGGTISTESTQGFAEEGIDDGNIQTSSRSYSSSGNYIYTGNAAQKTGSGLPQSVNNLRINNSFDVTASDNLQINGTLYLQTGSLIIPSGQALIANNKNIQSGNLIFERVLTGSPGWRMISSPIDSDYENYLSGVLTQGYDGAYYDANVAPNDTLQPNVMYYDESFEGTDNQRWRPPSSASSNIPSGRGHNVYLFGDVTSDNRYNDPLPDTLRVEGLENEGSANSVGLNVTYTAQADTGWNLVGNPYGAAIDWDDAANWTKTNIDQTIYVWEPDDKSYKTWNGTTGSLGNGIIPPFQAFWVKASGPNPELSVSEEAKTFGGTFVGKIAGNNPPEIELQLSYENGANNIFFTFYEDAKVGKDHFDGYYLEPPPGTDDYSEIYSIGRNGNRFNINALPLNFGIPIEIPIAANVFQNNQNISRMVDLRIAAVKNLPHSWNISLIDRQTKEEITVAEDVSVPFQTRGKKQKIKSDSTNVLQKEYTILAQSDPSEARFALRIHPGFAGTGLPQEIDLKPNYPNPFNPTTTIRFALPIQDKVTLEIFDILGRKVATLIDNKSFQAGLHKITWNASDVSSGMYVYRLVTDTKVISEKMTVIK